MTMLRPGDTIGILGGGQLARMLAGAAADLGLRTHVFAPEPDSPAFAVCADRTVAAYADEAALRRFAEAVAVVTYEFENVPAATAALLDSLRPVRPNPRALAITQDRLSEKTFVRGLGIATAPFAPVDDAASLAAAVQAMGLPALLKTRRLGYDGKGQLRLSPGDGWREAAVALGAPAILEGHVAFAREVSSVAARGVDGAFRGYPLCENAHAGGILARTTLPARVRPETEREGAAIARRIAEALDYVGVLAVEMFVVDDRDGERLVVNEIAPRVHNSGHWTREGAVTSQFEQHIRAVAGWPLGDTGVLGAVTMRNLIGDEAADWAAILGEEGTSLTLYGKAEARPGRKMGHVTRVTPGRPAHDSD